MPVAAAVGAAILRQTELPVGVILDGELVLANAVMRTLLGVDADMALPIPVRELHQPFDGAEGSLPDLIKVQDGEGHRHRLRRVSLEGQEGGSLLLGMREVANTQNPLLRLAYTDHLTGLANRAALQHRLSDVLSWARVTSRRCAMLVVDLDNFKPVNDAHGHLVGDRVLAEAASRLQALCAEPDLLVRFGGDEFILLRPEAEALPALARLATRIVAAMRAPICVGDVECFIGASVGIAVYPEDATHADDLFRSADEAMYAAKRAGRGTFRFASADISRAHVRRLLEMPRTGVGSIDEEHLELSNLLRSLESDFADGVEAPTMRAHINELTLYVESHFQHEEQVMRDAGFEGFDEHRTEHVRLLDELERLVATADMHCASLTMRFLDEWLGAHVELYDRPMGEAVTGVHRPRL
jgi:diguanylate cyclase (GGDEF)-like protein/hemerythrin-like metal-binding protein